MAREDEPTTQAPWPHHQHHDVLHHLATHTPITVARPSEASGAGFGMPGAWRLPPSSFPFPNTQRPLFGNSWQPPTATEWPSTNGKLSDWEKWTNGVPPPPELARPMPQMVAPMCLPQIMTAEPPKQSEPGNQTSSLNGYTHSPKEDERQSAEAHTASYDVSASQSPSDGEERMEENAEPHIDVEDVEGTTPSRPHSSTGGDQNTQPQEETTKEDDNQVSTTTVNTPTSSTMRDEEASSLLLNFSQSTFTGEKSSETSMFAQSGTKMFQRQNIESAHNSIYFSTDSSDFSNDEYFGTSAFSSPQDVQTNSVIQQTPTSSSQENSNTNGFCRPPGLGPSLFPQDQNGQTMVCPICGFSCPSKFHYNSHMNTHSDHQCTMCDYMSRTEGRLKKHMRESHSVEEQLAAGLDIEKETSQTPINLPTSCVTSTPLRSSSPGELSTTMASLVDAANLAASQEQDLSTISSEGTVSSSTGLLNTLASTGLPSALEQIKAFTEKSSMMHDGGGLDLASALGAMTGSMELDSPERILLNNSEPRRNSNGKIKQHKCKQCGHISLNKDDHWQHARTHIPADKQMNCQLCNFVTEYKHHLEYHVRNHKGLKPFQCKKCAYQCVNKSMLNSHMKSHTNVYQFRCMDCTYATKYCHSLKLHLKKYDHRRVPEGVEMGDTSPTQFGVKSENVTPFTFPMRPSPMPATTLAQTFGMSPITSQSLNYASQMLLRQHQMEQQMNLMNGLAGLSGQQQHQQLKCAICEFTTTQQDELLRHNVSHLLNSQSPMVSMYQALPQMSSLLPASLLSCSQESEQRTDGESGHNGDDEMDACSASPTSSSKGSGDEDSRKIKGFKVDQIGQRLQKKSSSCSEDGSPDDENKDDEMEQCATPEMKPMLPLGLPSLPSPSPLVPVTSSGLDSIKGLNLFQHLAQFSNALQPSRDDYRFTCPHCRMAFQEQALYQIHMGYHGYEHPFKCNRCGHIAPDALNFNLHLLQASHQ